MLMCVCTNRLRGSVLLKRMCVSWRLNSKTPLSHIVHTHRNSCKKLIISRNHSLRTKSKHCKVIRCVCMYVCMWCVLCVFVQIQSSIWLPVLYTLSYTNEDRNFPYQWSVSNAREVICTDSHKHKTQERAEGPIPIGVWYENATKTTFGCETNVWYSPHTTPYSHWTRNKVSVMCVCACNSVMCSGSRYAVHV